MQLITETVLTRNIMPTIPKFNRPGGIVAMRRKQKSSGRLEKAPAERAEDVQGESKSATSDSMLMDQAAGGGTNTSMTAYVTGQYSALSPDSNDEDFVASVQSSCTVVADNEVTFNFDAQSNCSVHSDHDDALARSVTLRTVGTPAPPHGSGQPVEIQVPSTDLQQRKPGGLPSTTTAPKKDPPQLRSNTRSSRRSLYSASPPDSKCSRQQQPKKKAAKALIQPCFRTDNDSELDFVVDKTAADDSETLSEALSIGRGVGTNTTVTRGNLSKMRRGETTDSETLSEPISLGKSKVAIKSESQVKVCVGKRSKSMKAKTALQKSMSQKMNSAQKRRSLMLDHPKEIIIITSPSDDTDDFQLMKEHRRMGSIASSRSTSKKRKLETVAVAMASSSEGHSSSLIEVDTPVPLSPPRKRLLNRNLGMSVSPSKSKPVNSTDRPQGRKPVPLVDSELDSDPQVIEKVASGSDEVITDIEVTEVPSIEVVEPLDSDSSGLRSGDVAQRQHVLQRWSRIRINAEKGGHGDEIVEMTASEDDTHKKVSLQKVPDLPRASRSSSRASRGYAGRVSPRGRQYAQLNVTGESCNVDLKSSTDNHTTQNIGLAQETVRKSGRNISDRINISTDSTPQRPAVCADSQMFSSVDASLDNIQVPVLSSDVNMDVEIVTEVSNRRLAEKRTAVIVEVKPALKGKHEKRDTSILETLASEMSLDSDVRVSKVVVSDNTSMLDDVPPVVKTVKGEVAFTQIDESSTEGSPRDESKNTNSAVLLKRKRTKTAKLVQLHQANQIKNLERAQRKAFSISTVSASSVDNRDVTPVFQEESSTIPEHPATDRTEQVITEECVTDDSISLITSHSPLKTPQGPHRDTSSSMTPNARVVIQDSQNRSQRTRRQNFDIAAVCGIRPNKKTVVCAENCTVRNVHEIMKDAKASTSETISSDDKIQEDGEHQSQDLVCALDSIEELTKEDIDNAQANSASKRPVVRFKRKKRKNTGNKFLAKKRKVAPGHRSQKMQSPNSSSSDAHSQELSQRLLELPKLLEPPKTPFSSTSDGSTVGHDSEATAGVDMPSLQHYAEETQVPSPPKQTATKESPVVKISETEYESDILAPSQNAKSPAIKIKVVRAYDNLFEKMDSELNSQSQEEKQDEQKTTPKPTSLLEKFKNRMADKSGKTTDSSDLDVPVLDLARKKLLEVNAPPSGLYYECSKVQPEFVRSTRHFKNSVIPKLKIKRSIKGSGSDVEMPDTPQKDEEKSLEQCADEAGAEMVKDEELDVRVQEELLAVYSDKQPSKKPRRKSSYQDDQEYKAILTASRGVSFPKKRGRPFRDLRSYQLWVDKNSKKYQDKCTPRNRSHSGPCRSAAAIQRSMLEKDLQYDPITKVNLWMSGNQKLSSRDLDPDVFYMSLSDSGLECGAEVEIVKTVQKKTFMKKVSVKVADLMDEWEAGTLDHHTERLLSMSLEHHKYIVFYHQQRLKRRKERRKEAEMKRYLSEITATDSDAEEKEEEAKEVNQPKKQEAAEIHSSAPKEHIELSEASDIYHTCSEPCSEGFTEVTPENGENTDHSYSKSPAEDSDNTVDPYDICNTMLVEHESEKKQVEEKKVPNAYEENTKVINLDTSHSSEESAFAVDIGYLTLSRLTKEPNNSTDKTDSITTTPVVKKQRATKTPLATTSDEQSKDRNDAKADKDDKDDQNENNICHGASSGVEREHDGQKAEKDDVFESEDDEDVELAVDKSDNEAEPDFDKWMEATLLDTADDDPSPTEGEGDGEQLAEDILCVDTELVVSQKHLSVSTGMIDNGKREEEKELILCNGEEDDQQESAKADGETDPIQTVNGKEEPAEENLSEDEILLLKEEVDQVKNDEDLEKYEADTEELLLPDIDEEHLPNKDVEDSQVISEEEEFSQLWSDHDDNVLFCESTADQDIIDSLSQRAAQPKARDVVLAALSQTSKKSSDKTPKKDEDGFLQPNLSDIPKSSKKYCGATSPKTRRVFERLFDDSVFASDSLLEAPADDAFEFSQQETPIVIEDDDVEDDMLESFSQLSQTFIKIESESDGEDDEELRLAMQQWEESRIKEEEEDQEDAKSVGAMSSASSTEHYLDLSMPDEEEELEQKDEQLNKESAKTAISEANNAEVPSDDANELKISKTGELRTEDDVDGVVHIVTEAGGDTTEREEEDYLPLENQEIPSPIKISSDHLTTEEEKEEHFVAPKQPVHDFKDVSDTEESSDDFASLPKTITKHIPKSTAKPSAKPTANLSKVMSKAAEWQSKATAVATAAPRSNAVGPVFSLAGRKGRGRARGQGRAAITQVTQARLVDGIEKARQQAQERLNKGRGHHDAQEAKEQNKLVDVPALLEDKHHNYTQASSTPNRRTRSGSKSSDTLETPPSHTTRSSEDKAHTKLSWANYSETMDTPPSHSTRSSRSKPSSSETRSRTKRLAPKPDERASLPKTPTNVQGPLTSTPFAAAPRARTMSAVTPSSFKEPITPVGSFTPYLPPSRNTNLPPLAPPSYDLTPKHPTPSSVSFVSPSIPPPGRILSPPHYLQASYSIPPGLEEPDFEELSTKFLPPDSQLASPSVVTPAAVSHRHKQQLSSLPPAKINVTVKRSLDNFLHHIVGWNPKWLAEQEKVGRQPPLVPEDAVFPLLETYDSYEDYVRIMMPLLFFETWEQMYQSWMQKKQRKCLLQQVVAFCGLGDVQKNALMEIRFQGVLKRPNENSPLPRTLSENDVVVVHLKLGKEGRPLKTMAVFGVVKRVTRCFSTRNKQIHPKLEPLLVGQRGSRPGILLEMTICMKYRELPYIHNETMEVEVVDSIVTSVRQYNALLFLPRSPLARDILRPFNERVFRPASCPPIHSEKTKVRRKLHTDV